MPTASPSTRRRGIRGQRQTPMFRYRRKPPGRGFLIRPEEGKPGNGPDNCRKRNSMYGIPENQDFSFLIGRRMLQLCIGLHQVQLNFDKGVSITIEGTFEHESPAGFVRHDVGVPESAASLVSLLGRAVESPERESASSLLVRFAGGRVLRLLDSSDTHESFQMYGPGVEIIV